MSASTARLRLPARCSRFGIGGLAAATLLAFAPLPASAAVTTQPGLMHSIGQSLALQAAGAEPLLVRSHRRSYRRSSRRTRRDSYYFAIPLVIPPAVYYTPRPYVGGQCAYWHRRCVATWGYSNSNYRGCMRYHGC